MVARADVPPLGSRISPTGRTWLAREEDCYPSGGLLRRGRAILRQNPHNPIVLPYGEVRAVLAGIPETYFSTLAKLRFGGRTVHGFLMLNDNREWEFTPNAPPVSDPFQSLPLDLDHSSDDLRTFLATYKRGQAWKLFGDRRGGETALRRLRQYARLRLVAIDARIAGRIDRAIRCEDAAERFYRLLPEWARW